MVIATEKIEPLIAYIRKKELDDATLRLSQPPVTAYQNTIQKIGIRFSAPMWEIKPNLLEDEASTIPPFSWLDSKEDSKNNRTEYMAYLNKNITLPPHSKLFDATMMRGLLSTEIVPHDVRISGNIDIVLAAEHHQKALTTRNEMWAGIELKKDMNDTKADETQRQVVLQHLAASFLNEDTGILTIMSDLCERWYFYWFSKEKNALMIYIASSRGEACYLIRHMMDTDQQQNTTPQDFLNRASWNQMFQEKHSSTQGLDTVVDETWKEGQDKGDINGRAGSSEEQGPSNHGGQQQNNQSRGSGGNDAIYSARGNEHVMMDTLDFMDEEEEKEAIFREVLECILPQMGYLPRRGLGQSHHAEDPPSHIEVLQE
jgi:hypothetical protein